MKDTIAIFIKKRKAFIGVDRKGNTIIIDRNRLRDKGYRNEIVERLTAIENAKNFQYIPARQRKVIKKVNDAPLHDSYNGALVGVIKRNERAWKDIERLRDLLK